jgi:lipoate-protein ligase A
VPAHRSIRVIRRTVADAQLDTALSRVVLQQVGSGVRGPTLRLNPARRVVAFGKHDTLVPGYPTAVRAALDQGFDAIVRLAGGRAAVFHEETLAFSWTIPVENPTAGIHDRFRTISSLMVRAFARLGIASHVGEIPGEYCPGEYSVSVPPGRKVMGVGQRLARRAAHVGGVVVVQDSDAVRNVLIPVYAALGLDWRPSTAGSLADAEPAITVLAAAEAILAEADVLLGSVSHGDFDDDTMDLARRTASEHRPAPDLHLG